MKRTLDGIEYNYIDPTGNITILVDSVVDLKDYATVAKLLMDSEKKCEQVGFVKKSDIADIKLDMAAGEFCGNATMSAAALFCDNKGMKPGETKAVRVEASGTNAPVLVDITLQDNRDGEMKRSDCPRVSFYKGQVEMPAPRGITQKVFEYGGRKYDLPVVDMDGISHIITSSKELGMTDGEVEDALKTWWNDIRSSCLGIMLADNVRRMDDNAVTADVRPLVYAPDVGTCFWETSCASGTTALFVYLDREGGGCDSLAAKEPGGKLEVTHSENMNPLLTGNVVL